MSGIDSFEWVGRNLFKCKDCGVEVKSGIINISTHWANCTGMAQVDNIKKIANMPLNARDKIDLIKGEAGIDQ